MNDYYGKAIMSLADRAAEAIPIEDGDYIGDDGLLYCGKCHTKKQTRVNILGNVMTPMCLCKCRADERYREEAERKQEERRRRIAEMRSNCFPEYTMQNWTFDKDDRENAKISNVARKYVEHFPEMLDKGKGLLFYGTVGTGKTFYSAAICNALLDKGYPCLMTSFSRLANTVFGLYEDKQDYIDGLNDYSLLVVDDLAVERDTDFMNEIVQTVIDSRYRAGLPMIVTTNLTAAELKQPADIGKRRTYSRLLEMCLPVEVAGKDRRRKKLVNDYAEYERVLGL